MKRAILSSRVREYIRDGIINLRFKPGEQLNELELTKTLKISRSPLREAFRHLESEGLVSRFPDRGVFVRIIDARDLHEMITVRAALECLAAEIATPLLTAKRLKTLTKLTSRIEVAAKKRNIKRYVKLNSQFHMTIVKAAKNRRLEEIFNNLEAQSLWVTSAALRRKIPSYGIRNHRSIVLALKKKDGKRAAQCMKSHIDKSGKIIVDFLQREK